MKDITSLHPRLQAKASELLASCSAHGIKLRIGECLRTVAEQDALYAQGRTVPGSIITNAKGDTFSSQHQWGIAFDFYLDMDVDGDGQKADDSFNDSTGLFERVGALAKALGLGWGGDWVSFKDRPHLYLSDWGSTTVQLKKQYGTPGKFIATWGTSPSIPVTAKPVPSGSTIIQNIQTWCKTYAGATLAVDGKYGSQTKQALCKALQHYHNITWRAGLTEDGIFGASTKAVCRVASGKSELVYVAQSMLYCLGYEMSHSIKNNNPDGQAGSGMVAAVTKFQKDKGLVPDGLCGRDCFSVMFR